MESSIYCVKIVYSTRGVSRETLNFYFSTEEKAEDFVESRNIHTQKDIWNSGEDARQCKEKMTIPNKGEEFHEQRHAERYEFSSSSVKYCWIQIHEVSIDKIIVDMDPSDANNFFE